jgi:cytochrome c5
MKYIVGIVLSVAMFSCTQKNTNETLSNSELDALTDPAKGIGIVRNVALTNPLELDKVERGRAIYLAECRSCHTLDDQLTVGPGWKDITQRRKPEWIMNMITNVDVMLDNDEEALKLMEACGTRMRVETMSLSDARDVLEFMRENDGEK